MRPWKAALTIAVVLLTAGAARAEDSEVQALKRRVEEQDRRIQELERGRAATQSDLEKVMAGMQAGKAPEGGDVVSWKQITGAASKLKFYGFIRLDIIRDDSRPNNTQTIAWIRSEDPLAPTTATGFGAEQNREDLTIHPRLTRFGMDFDGPTVEKLGNAKLTGKLEIDFYNNGLAVQAESRAAPRMRHAWVKMSWKESSLLAGQSNDIIAPLWPSVNPDLVMWGAGNLGDRRAQVRYEWTPKVGEKGNLVLQAMAGETGADDNADLDANGTRDGEASGRPTYQLRAAWKQAMGEKKQNFEVGIWGTSAEDTTDTRVGGSRHFRSRGYGLDFTVPVWSDRAWVKGELFRGKNLDDVRGGIFQGVNTAAGKEISTQGGWIELGVKTCACHTISVGRTVDDPNNGHLATGGRARNSVWYIGNKFNFDPVEFGLDFMHWETSFIGFDHGNDNRIQASITYKF